MSRILGVDPGDSTGWAMIEVLDKKITPIEVGVMKPFNLGEAKKMVSQCDIVVIENFLVDPRKARQGAFDRKANTTSEIIGKYETLAELDGKRIVRQPNTTKPVGYAFSNQKYVPGKKGLHYQDALAHACFYAVKVLGAIPVGVSKPGCS